MTHTHTKTHIPFVDCQGLAGAWTLGTVQTGKFKLVHRTSLPGGFGDACIRANEHLVGADWEQQTGIPHETWTPQDNVGLVCGTPPCSGFSLLNSSKGKNARGSSSDINKCMVELVTYASQCTGLDGKPGPELVSLESVQQAYTQGRDLMQKLRAIMEENTGQQYAITHTLLSGSSVGAAQMRHRYYLVLHRIPFSVTTPEVKHVVTYRDAIGDLVGADWTWDEQQYPVTQHVSGFAGGKRNNSLTFTDHAPPSGGSAFLKFVEEMMPYWRPGEPANTAVERMGRKPDSVKEHRYNADGWVMDGRHFPRQKLKGWSWPTRIHPDKPGFVLTGGGIMSQVHWEEPRLLTVRECARLMGYPDSWEFKDVAGGKPMAASMLIGKCCPVESGRWISNHLGDAILAAHGGASLPPSDVKEIGDREYYHNHTNVYKTQLKKQLAEAGVQ